MQRLWSRGRRRGGNQGVEIATLRRALSALVATIAFWIDFGFLVYGVLSGIVWLTYGGFPRWYGVPLAVVVVVSGLPALVLPGSQF